MGNCCFQYDDALASIHIPNSVTALWDDDGDGVNETGSKAIGATFMGCIGLKEITIGSGITRLDASGNGVFNPDHPDYKVGATQTNVGDLQKVTCYSCTPPVADGLTFMMGHYNARLFVPEGCVNNYITSWWWDFASSDQNAESYGKGIYEIGTCMLPENLKAKPLTGYLTWSGDAGAYNIIVSETELDAEALETYASTGTVYRTTETEFDLSLLLEKDNIIYYVYLQSDCGDDKKTEWISTSFYSYTGPTCEWTVFGGNYMGTGDPQNPDAGFGPGTGAGLEFWQKGVLAGEVRGAESLLSPTVSLIDGESVTIKWIGNAEDGYGDPNSIYITDNKGNTVFSKNRVNDNSSETLGVYDVNCSGTAIERSKPIAGKITVAPTLSSGFITVSGATAGSTVKVMDARGRVLKSEAIATGSKRIELNYTNGLYFIVAHNGKNIVTEKVILKK
jgi:hypothetical protein